MKILRLFAILCSGLLLYASAQTPNAGLTVQTQQGQVAGSLVLPKVRKFLGVPFATAKRWQAPELPAARKNTLQATEFGDSCFQELNSFNVGYLVLSQQGGINITSSEGCLTANIWAPSMDRKQKTAVLVWIYGGGFTFGTSNLPFYDGQNFVRDNDDITLVTFNYRLNIFGQPNAPQLGAKNINFSLLDIEAAIQWVHSNIANFGGDPNRIVLFGQSAGAAAADAYTFSHPQSTFVKGIIEQSGSVSGGVFPLSSLPTVNTDWITVASSVGCGNATNPEQFACMEKVPAATLEAATINTGAAFNVLIDDVTIFEDTQTLAANGNFLRVPLLGGTVANEFDVFEVDQELISLGTTIPTIGEVISDIGTLVITTCPAGSVALHRINANVPTWRYQYQGIFPNLMTRPELRTYHASEIPLVFGTYNSSKSGVPATPTEIALSRYVQSAWAAFARDPQQGLLEFGWPAYSPNTTSLAQLGNVGNKTGVVFTQGKLIDFGCAQAEALTNIQNQLESFVFGS